MRVTTTPSCYVVTDRRQDGTLRELQRFADLIAALRYRDALLEAGGYVEVQLIPTEPEAA